MWGNNCLTWGLRVKIEGIERVFQHSKMHAQTDLKALLEHGSAVYVLWLVALHTEGRITMAAIMASALKIFC